jgi:hypothetical protein
MRRAHVLWLERATIVAGFFNSLISLVLGLKQLLG